MRWVKIDARWIILGVVAALLCSATLAFREAERRIESHTDLSEAGVLLDRLDGRPLAGVNSSSDALVIDAMLGRLPFAHADFAIVMGEGFAAQAAAIKSSPEIKDLRVIDVTVDEERIEQLGQLRHLRALTFISCSISEESLLALQKQLPHCQVGVPKSVQLSKLPPQQRDALRAYARFIE